MSCYDEYKAERAARAKKQHKNPLIDQFGTEGGAQTAQQPRAPITPTPQSPESPPEQQPPPPAQQQTAPPPLPERPAGYEPGLRKPPAPAEAPPAQPQPPPKSPAGEVCDVCKKPIADFKIPLKGGKKVCMGCNDMLRDVAKSLILNVQCPHCGKEIQVSQE
jgi:hypothetical protein